LLGNIPIELRIITAQFKTFCRKPTIVQVYALNSTDEEIEEFYSEMQDTIQRVSSKDLLDIT